MYKEICDVYSHVRIQFKKSPDAESTFNFEQLSWKSVPLTELDQRNECQNGTPLCDPSRGCLDIAN